MVKNIVFMIFVVLTIGSAGAVAFVRKPVHAAFALLFTLFGVAGLYVFIGADFLAAGQVMVYVGGILVLILFGIMLTRRAAGIKWPETLNTHWAVSGIATLILFIALLKIIFKTPWKTIPIEKLTPTTAEIGNLLLTRYLLPFEVASLLLLVATLGAVIIVRKELK